MDNTKMRTKLLKPLCLAAFLIACGFAQAQTYPSKPIRIVVPWPAGGGGDTAARIISQPLSERIGQPVVIENRPGAGGNIGTALFAQEKPDGYALLIGAMTPHVVNPHLYAKLGFDPIKDFTPVAQLYSVPNFLVVPASSPVNSAKELVALAKANPGKLNFGSAGLGSTQHLFGVMFKTAANIDIVHVAYKGTSPAETALIAGQIDLLLDPPTCLPFVAAGKLKALAIAAPTRNPAVPDVPTLDEVGIPNVHTMTYYGLLAPANTPNEIVNRLNKEINSILQTPEMNARLAKLAAQPGTGTPEDFAQLVKDELVRYGEIVRLSGAKQVD